ncbi:hypothetical protein MELB17_22265 [Marinobacter sp. ELB17]|nr:hypothetical protein MELB17_22265 [Marinobacter sp. ELB17]
MTILPRAGAKRRARGFFMAGCVQLVLAPWAMLLSAMAVVIVVPACGVLASRILITSGY